jgi:serine/threonine-protein kinase
MSPAVAFPRSDIPERIAGFQLAEEIARGGMGAVYKAHQISIDRVVALKVLSARYTDDPVFRERFLREARAAARLNHPNIVQAIDVGEAGGHFYFAMEFVDGRSLAALLKDRGRLLPEEACAIVLQVARALEHAALYGMVHLDVKPSNILVTPAGLAKLADFGLARHVEDTDLIYSRRKIVFGTPHYMAPEQLESGAAGAAADARCDLYALGVTFYELVTGRNPFSARTSREVLENVRSAQVAPAHIAEPAIPEDFGLVIAKMMHPDPEQRYQNATQLLLDLDALSRRRPPPVARNIPLEAAAPPPAPPRTLLIVLFAGSAAALLLTVAVLLLANNRAQRNQRFDVGGEPPPDDFAAVEIAPADTPGQAVPEVATALHAVVGEAERLMGQEDYLGALGLYREFIRAHPGESASEEAERAALGVRRRAQWHAEALEQEAAPALDEEDFDAVEGIADRIGEIGLSETDVVAQRLRNKVRRGREEVARRQEEARREAVAKALERFQGELSLLLAQERFQEGVQLCADFLAEPEYASVHQVAQAQIDRVRALDRIQEAVRQGAREANKSLLSFLRDFSSEELRRFAAAGTRNTVLLHTGLAALYDLQGRSEEAAKETQALRETRIQLPKWIVDIERRSLLAGAQKALNDGRPEQALDLLRALDAYHGRSTFVRSQKTEIEALVQKVRAALTRGMALIPAGQFIHQKDLRVTQPEFYIDLHEVTNAEYAEFLRALDKAEGPSAWDHPLQPHWKRGHVPIDWDKLKSKGNHPVVGVDWFDAYAYSAWRGRRLPTDREWEKAARGTDGRRYPWGPSWKDGMCNSPPAVAATVADLPTAVAPVGGFPQGNSPYGIADMAGNAREWVTDEVASSSDTVYTRGGSWSDPAMACGTTYRLPANRMTRDLATGFRCAMDPISATGNGGAE